MTKRIGVVLAIAAVLLANLGWGGRIPTCLAAEATPTPRAGVGQQAKGAMVTATAAPENPTLLDLAAMAPVPADAAETDYGVRSRMGYDSLDEYAFVLTTPRHELGGT